MIKLRKPFSQKIYLHIRQDMLQKLWDKYVPASSSAYEKIQLVYLDGAGSQEGEQPRQIQLLISLVLKNRMLQMGAEQYPSSLAFCVKRLEHSLRRVEKYYFTQLKSSNFAAFQTLNQYVALLEEREKESQRYSEWKKEQQVIEKQWEQYDALSLFSVQVKEFFKEYSCQMIQAMETELFDVMPEPEYETLAGQLIWQRKSELLTYLRTCGEMQCRQIVERLKEETALCKSLALKAGLPEAEKKEKKGAKESASKKANSRDRFARLKFSEKKYAKIKPEKEEPSIGRILTFLPGRTVGEKLARAADLLEQKEFRQFCQAVALDGADRQAVIWEKNRKEMISYIAQAKREELQQLWTQLTESYSEKITLLLKQHQREIIYDFRKQILAMAQKESFQAIADVIKAWDTEELNHSVHMDISEVFSEEDSFEESRKQIAVWDEMHQYLQKVEQVQEVWKEKIKQREAQAFETYQEQYQEILREKNPSVQQRKDRELVEAAFRNQHKKNIYQENMTEEDIRSICQWGQVVLAVFGENKDSKTAGTEDRKQGMETVQTVDMEYAEELIYLVQQVNHYLEEQNMDGKASVLTWRENQQKEEKTEYLRELFHYMHVLNEEQKVEFARQLADAVFIWQQVNISQQFSEEFLTEGFSELKQKEQKQLVEETFLEQHKENIYQENITKEEIQNICEWGRTILECTDGGNRIETGSSGTDSGKFPEELEYKEELVYLMEQVNQQIEKQASNGEVSILVWKKVQLEEEKIEHLQKLLAYIHTLKEKQRTEFVRQLADAVFIWQQVNASQQFSEEFLTESFSELKQRKIQDVTEQEEKKQLAEETFWKQHKENIYQENITKEEIQNICEWGRTILECTEEGNRIETGSSRTDSEEFPEELEYKEELVYLMEQVSQQIEKQAPNGEVSILTWKKGQLEEEKIEHLQKLLTYIHMLKEKQRTEFVRQLADAVFIWQQVNASQQFSEEFLTEGFSELKQRKIQDVAQQEEKKQLVEETFWKQHKEDIYQENITKEEIQNICEWGRAVLECTEEGNRIETGSSGIDSEEFPKELEYKEELVYLMEQVSQQIEKQVPNGEVSMLTWKKVQLEEEKIENLQRLLTYTHTLKEEKRTEFARQLADAVLIWQQIHTLSSEELHNEYLTVSQRADVVQFVERLFQNRHRKNIYQEDITREEIRNICQWSKAVLESVEPMDAKPYGTAADLEHPVKYIDEKVLQDLPEKNADVKLERKEELVHLIGQINHYIQERDIYGELPALTWQEGYLGRETENLLIYIHTLKEEQRAEFMEQLADAVLIWQQMDVFRQSQFAELALDQLPVPAEDLQQEETGLASVTYQEFPAEDPQQEETGLAGVTYQELWEWGESLLFYPEDEQEWENADILFGQEQNGQSFSQDGYQEDIQTQVIRHQIEAAKDRNNLQQLMMQINHYTDSRQKIEEQAENVQAEKIVPLVYKSGQLKSAPVQRLVRYLRTLDEEQYGILVKELSQITRFQQINHDKPAGKDEILNRIKQIPLKTELRQKDETDRISQNTASMEHRKVERLAAAYPGLVYHIEEYERRHHLSAQGHIRKLIQPYAYQLIESEGKSYRASEGDGIDGPFFEGRQDKARFQQMVYGNVWETNSPLERELQYSIKRDDTSKEEQQKTEMRMRQETIQMKSAQEQLGRKLKEVEEELKKVEGFSRVNTDVNVLADQVKKQLYEELHVEKLRRGMA